jgi:hypothetical protein
MKQGNGKPVPYEVAISDQIKATIKQLHAEAAQKGRGHTFLTALRTIHEHLQSDPRQFGDPLFHLASLKLLIYRAIIASVIVHYGVHDEKPIVIVRTVKVLD